MNKNTFFPTQKKLFGVLDVRVDLTIFEEPIRIEVCAHQDTPIHRGTSPFSLIQSIVKNESTECGCVPSVVHNCSTSGDEESPIYIILHHPMRDPEADSAQFTCNRALQKDSTERSRRSPSQDLLHDGGDVG
jgi:hypothetical protein